MTKINPFTLNQFDEKIIILKENNTRVNIALLRSLLNNYDFIKA